MLLISQVHFFQTRDSLNKTREIVYVQCAEKNTAWEINNKLNIYIHWLKTLPKSTTVENTAWSVTKKSKKLYLQCYKASLFIEHMKTVRFRL